MAFVLFNKLKSRTVAFAKFLALLPLHFLNLEFALIGHRANFGWGGSPRFVTAEVRNSLWSKAKIDY